MPYSGPGPSPFGREDACGDGGGGLTGNGGADTNAMDSPRAETAATLTNTATYFYVWDQVGSIRLVTDGTGAVVVEHDYEPYGVEILPNAPTSMPTDALAGTHLYTGQERDGDTGLDNFHFRSYASTMGRFLSPDNLPGTPLNPQSFNLYAYVHGNPVNYNDPTGHWAAGLPPGSTDYYGDPFGGLNFAPTGGIFEPMTTVDALAESATGNQSTQSTTQPAAQDKQDPKPTAGQQGTKNFETAVGVANVVHEVGKKLEKVGPEMEKEEEHLVGDAAKTCPAVGVGLTAVAMGMDAVTIKKDVFTPNDMGSGLSPQVRDEILQNLAVNLIGLGISAALEPETGGLATIPVGMTGMAVGTDMGKLINAYGKPFTVVDPKLNPMGF
jgi:RHS repeat-associated protein